MNKIQWTVASVALLSMVGCAALNDAKYENTQKARAALQYHKCGKPKCERFPHDYKLGWLDGFYTVSTGGPNCPPAVAPQRYWDPKQVLEDCDNRRHAFYSGWQDGAAHASEFPDTHHLRIYETCECPMPRCESNCGTAGCGPCGANYIGAPVYDELIEAPYTDHVPYTESMMPVEPLVPPAPIMEDDAEEYPEQDDANDLDDDTASVVPTPPKDLVAQETPAQQLAVPHDELLKQNDADTIFGSAFDVMLPSESTVKLQPTDPAKNLSDDPITVKATAKVQVIEVKETDLAKEEFQRQRQAEAAAAKAEQERLAQAKIAQVSNAKPEVNLPFPFASTTTAAKPAGEAVKSSQDASSKETPPQIQPKSPVQAATEINLAADQADAKTGGNQPAATPKVSPTRQASVNESPTVSVKTLPVTFEMIESDQPPVVLAK